MKKFLIELITSVLGKLLPKLFKPRTSEDALGSGDLEKDLRSQIGRDGWTDEN